MADPSEPFSTLDDFLLSLADGVTQAQSELARAGTLGPPGRQFSYHLPRVDFELKLNLRVVEDASLSNRYQPLRAARPNNKHLLFQPVASSAASTLDIAAVVRGAFVAVPENGGLPSVVLSASLSADDPRAPRVRVTARNSAGEPISGLNVEFNVDREESAAFSAAAGQTLSVAPGTAFERSVVATNAAGVAEATLVIAADQAPGLLALVLDAAGRNETLVFEVRA